MTGKQIKLFRVFYGLKGYELAKLIQITPDRLSKIEMGHMEPTQEIVKAIKDLMDTYPEIGSQGKIILEISE